MPPQFALSTWSLHRALGISFPDSPEDAGDGQARETWGQPRLSLLELPAQMAARGLMRLEICSFHLNRRDEGYLDAVKSAVAEAGVTLQALLIDDGDLNHPVHGDRDAAWIGHWIDVAAQLGAESARVIAGKQVATDETRGRSIAALTDLGRRGADQGVRVTTENWFDTTASPHDVHAILDALDGAVGFLADFGNWSGPTKYADLASILTRADYCHAKCSFDHHLTMASDDFEQCLSAASDANYAGPFTLIYESSNEDEWRGIEMERDFILAHSQSNRHFSGQKREATG